MPWLESPRHVLLPEIDKAGCLVGAVRRFIAQDGDLAIDLHKNARCSRLLGRHVMVERAYVGTAT